MPRSDWLHVESKPHHYLPDAVGTSQRNTFIAEAGMEMTNEGTGTSPKRMPHAAARLQQGTFWIGTERTLTASPLQPGLLHAGAIPFPPLPILPRCQEVWPWGELPPFRNCTSPFPTMPPDLVEATIWKVVADAAAQGHLLADRDSSRSRISPLLCFR